MARRTRQSPLDRLSPPGGVVTSVRPVASRPGHVSARVGRKSTSPILAKRAAAIGLEPGAPWTPELRQSVAQEILIARERESVIRAASSRPMSRRQVELKLARKHVPAEQAREIARDLEAKGVINDDAFAHAAASSELSRKPAGQSLIINKLRAKGIDAKTATSAVVEVFADREYDPLAGAIELARRKARSLARLAPEVAQRRLYGALARRGFEADICRRAMRVALGPQVDDAAQDSR